MTNDVGVVGDVHGNIDALLGLVDVIEDSVSRLVFAGDYINRGKASSEVIQFIIDLGGRGDIETFCIAGNHDIAFLECIDDGDIVGFLRLGGAGTIRSYISTPEDDVLEQLRRDVPADHVHFLRSLKSEYREDELVVTHAPVGNSDLDQGCFHVFGHVPQESFVPSITKESAAIDTGCGTFPEGRLTCFLWPSREYVQVDSSGRKL